jgi:hypothetical protein
LLLNQPVFNERPLKTSRVKRLQLTFATLSGSSLLPGISSIFANEGASDTQGGTLMDETPSEDAGGLFSGFMSKIKSSASGEPTIPRCVLVFIIKGKLYIVKENWNEWDCDYSTCSLEEKKQKKKEIMSHAESPKDSVRFEDLKAKEAVERMQELRDRNKVKLFDVLICLDIGDIVRLYVHKGSVPSVEIRCFASEGDKKEDEDAEDHGEHDINLRFTGDMERQLFVSRIWDYRRAGGQGASDEEEEDEYQEDLRGRAIADEENEDSMSEGDKGSDSDEEYIEATIYD